MGTTLKISFVPTWISRSGYRKHDRC